jgi:Mg2+ and Co2+ transporter CorA
MREVIGSALSVVACHSSAAETQATLTFMNGSTTLRQPDALFPLISVYQRQSCVLLLFDKANKEDKTKLQKRSHCRFTSSDMAAPAAVTVDNSDSGFGDVSGYIYDRNRRDGFSKTKTLRIKEGGEESNFFRDDLDLHGGRGALGFLGLSMDRNRFSQIRKRLKTLLDLEMLFVRERNRASFLPSGRLLALDDGNAILLETPLDSGPYLFLLLAKATREGPGHQRGSDVPALMQGVYVYSHTGFKPPEEYPAHSTRGTDDLAHVMSSWMLNWLLNLHLDWITETSRQIQDQVEAMEEGFRTALPQSPKELRDMMKKRSDCNHTIRTINLRTRIDFTARVFTIAQKVWPSASNDHETSALMHKITQSKEYDPIKLMERTEAIGIQITEITAQIAEDTAEKQRKREERLQDLSMQIQELSVEIASYAIRDSGTMRGIGWVTMAFLPATFVTSFFGMNFFNGVEGVQAFDKTSKNVWIFFVVAVPITVIVLLVFRKWDRKQEAKVQDLLARRDRGRGMFVEDGGEKVL